MAGAADGGTELRNTVPVRKPTVKIHWLPRETQLNERPKATPAIGRTSFAVAAIGKRVRLDREQRPRVGLGAAHAGSRLVHEVLAGEHGFGVAQARGGARMVRHTKHR